MVKMRPEYLETGGPWALYDQMIEGLPEDVRVTDYAMGVNWSYVDTEAGMGVAYTTAGGAKRIAWEDLRGERVKDVALLAKSWSFREATLGIAALNAWYSNKQRVLEAGLKATFEEKDTVGFGSHQDKVGKKLDAFDQYKPEIEAKPESNVVVVGHFPNVEKMAEYSNLVVLERKCSDEWDTPDPACEYVMPKADFAFITGVTLINKTAPRLLELARDARVVMVGPSVVLTDALFDYGVETMSGSIVTDPEGLAWSVKNGAGKLFGQSLQMCTIAKR